MEDVLLNIGSLIEVENKDEGRETYMIIGTRVISPKSMKAWDYVAVWYPTGLVRTFKSDGEFVGDDFFYCNHPDIDEIVHEAKLINLVPENMLMDEEGVDE